MTSSLDQVLASLELDRVNAAFFVGTQLDAPENHILGGHIAAQALAAAGHTAVDRPPHSMHTYFLRPGDARRPVDFEVTELQQGRTFAARRVTARQDGEVLLECMASFKAPSGPASPDDPGAVEYQPPMPAVPEPESLPVVAPHVAETAEVSGNSGLWASLRWYERRIVDADRIPPARSRIWWRPDTRDGAAVPENPLLGWCLVAYLSAVTLPEPAFAARPKPSPSALRDHAVWFHRPPELTDWLLYDQTAPSSVDLRSMAGGLMFNRNGDLVCTAKQEMYFPPPRR